MRKAKGKEYQRIDILECEDFEHIARVEPKHVSALQEALAVIERTQVTIKAWARYTHSMTEQHRLLLLHAWADFHKDLGKVESLAPPVPPLTALCTRPSPHIWSRAP